MIPKALQKELPFKVTPKNVAPEAPSIKRVAVINEPSETKVTSVFLWVTLCVPGLCIYLVCAVRGCVCVCVCYRLEITVPVCWALNTNN